MSTSARLAYSAIRGAALGVAKPYWRFEVVDVDRIPSAGGCVLAPIHRSNLDFLIAGMAVPRPVKWMAKSTIFKGGTVDRFLLAMGATPVHRERVDRKAIRESLEFLHQGFPVVIFPEGRRKEGPAIEDPFDGAAFLACRARVPMIPMGIAGSDEAMPIGSKLVRPKKVIVTIGEPIYPDVAVSGAVARAEVQATTRALARSIQAEYERAQRLRSA